MSNFPQCVSDPKGAAQVRRSLSHPRPILIPRNFCCATERAENVHTSQALRQTTHVSLAAASALLSFATTAGAAAATEAATSYAAASPAYTPSNPLEGELAWQVWVGFIAGVFPFLIASIEFGKRIVIQRRCETCKGRGLVSVQGTRGPRLVKCRECGGMLPWLSWKAFWSANLRPGNGGPLLQPKGQTSVLYRVPPKREQSSSSREEGMRENIGNEE
jgi:hypothetical protein